MEEPLIVQKVDQERSSSSEQSQYDPPKTPGSEADQEAKKPLKAVEVPEVKPATFLQALAKVFHEPEIPLEDKVILGPIDKYIRYSKSQSA